MLYDVVLEISFSVYFTVNSKLSFSTLLLNPVTSTFSFVNSITSGSPVALVTSISPFSKLKLSFTLYCVFGVECIVIDFMSFIISIG